MAEVVRLTFGGPNLPGSEILIVTADSALGNDMAQALHSYGYLISHASTCAEATAAAQEGPPDLAVLDLVLPDGDGLLLCTTLRAIADMRILIIGAGDRRDTILGLRLGADDFLAKPVDPDEFEARVEALLRRRPHRPDSPM